MQVEFGIKISNMNIISEDLSLRRERENYSCSIVIIQDQSNSYEEHLDKLHSVELEKFKKFKNQISKKNYLLGRMSAKLAIEKFSKTDCNFKSILINNGVFQFPYIKNDIFSNINLSISHCKGIGFSAAFPVSHPMGVDVEAINENNLIILEQQLTNKEKGLTYKIKDIVLYTSLFSMKEALSKVLKTGMMIDFNILEIEKISVNQNILSCTFSNFKQYRAHAIIRDHLVFSIVSPKFTQIDLETLNEKLNALL